MHLASGSLHEASFTVRPRTTWEIIRQVARYLRPYPWMALGTIACALLSLAASFAYPKLTRLILDEVIGQRRAELLTPVILALLGAFVARDLFNSLRIRLNNTFEQNVIFDMRREVYARLQRLPVGWFDQRASGDLMTRVIEDVNSVERLLIDGTEQGAVAVLSVVVVAVILFLNQPMLAAVATLAARYRQPSEVSMERTMGCGLGGCYSCVVPVKQDDGQTRYVRSCIGGPVFDGAAVAWD